MHRTDQTRGGPCLAINPLYTVLSNILPLLPQIRNTPSLPTQVFLWKMAIHLLRLYNPGKKGRQRTESWHAPLAGAISGLAVLAETPRNRVGIAQQLFVR